MRKNLVSLFGFFLLVQSAPLFAEGKPEVKVIEVEGVAKPQKVTCTAGETVEITSTSSEITLSGSCGLVEMTGSANQINIETATTVKVTGASTQFTIKTANTIDITGASNEVSVESISTIKLTGTANSVTWASSPTKSKKPKISKKGVGNVVSKKS